jgi:uncharacterized membrane protein
MRLKYLTVLTMLILSLMTVKLSAQSLTWLGTLGAESSEAYAVSADGAIVVGQIRISSGESRAVKWAASTGLQILNGLQNINSWARAISSDGSIIVGTAQENVRKAFRCINNNSFEYLVPLGGSDFNTSQAYDVSSDGSKIVGAMTNLSDEVRGFIWSESLGMTELSTLLSISITPRSEVSSISGDGGWIVGRSAYSDVNFTYSALPVEWVNTPIYNIRTLPYFQPIEYGVVEEISENGSYAVGEFMINGKLRGERWHREPPGIWSPYTDVGLLEGIPDSVGICYALDVSNDGEVVGQTTDSSPFGTAAYIWERTSLNVMYNLNELYSNLINQSGYLISANAITPDGRYIVGRGYRLATHKDEAFLLDRGPLTDVEDERQLPTEFSLEQNYPNPFNPSTKIKYTIPNVSLSGVEVSNVQIKVYDVLGNEVATLVNDYKTAGSYEVEFDASKLSSGIYFYRLQAGSFVETKKMNLMK